MKRNQNLLATALVCCLSMASVVMVAGGKKTASFYPGYTAAINDTTPKTGLSKSVQAVEKAVKDAVPKVQVPKVQVPKVAAPKANSNLFKKIAEAFRFRKHAQENEKKRVLAIFESLGVNDSIAASAENIHLLIDELSQRENQHFDSLMAIISEIKNRKPEVITVEAKPTAKPEPETEAAEPSESKTVTDKDIEDLTNKLLPLIAEKAGEDKSVKDKRITLSAIRKVRTSPTVQVFTMPDSAKKLIKRFVLNIKNRAEVYGIHNYIRNNLYDDYKLSALNTLLYNAIFINGKTGNIKDLNGWDTAGIITAAQKEGCNVMFTARIQQDASTDAFLGNTKAQKTFVDNAIFLLKSRHAKGVNIHFSGVRPGNEESFNLFIKFLSEVLKIQDSSYKVMVTIPVFTNTNGYNLKALDQYTDRFLVDFTAVNTSAMGPMTPLQGSNNSMETVLSKFLNADIAPSKLIPTVSYVGTKWSVSPSGAGRFIQPLTYAEIRRRYNWPVYYDDESASAVMDSLNAKSAPVRTIFFDDAVSLEKKYDYIIQNGMGGVAIDALGYDRGYGDLWDALTYKFAVVDTVYLKDSLMGKPINTDLNFVERFRRYLTLFGYVLNNPCEICFENISDTAYSAKINRDLQELQIDSVIVAENRGRPFDKKFRSKFEFVNYQLTRCLGLLTLFLLVVALIGGGIYLYKIRSESEEWKWKKKAEIALIGLCVLLVLSAFTYLFTNDTIPIFGATPKSGSTVFSKQVSALMAADPHAMDTVNVVSDSNEEYCKTDPEDDCINMPFPTLMIIIIVGMVIGVLITRYLIMPLLRRNDIP